MNEVEPLEYVGFRRRALAFFLDNLVWLFGVLILLGFVPVDDADDISDEAAAVFLFVVATLWFNYFAFSEWRWGQTIGKNATSQTIASFDSMPVPSQTRMIGASATFGTDCKPISSG